MDRGPDHPAYQHFPLNRAGTRLVRRTAEYVGELKGCAEILSTPHVLLTQGERDMYFTFLQSAAARLYGDVEQLWNAAEPERWALGAGCRARANDNQPRER